MANTFVGFDNIVPVLAPADIVATGVDTEYVSLNCHEIGFLIIAGSLTATSADEYYSVTVIASTSAATGASEVACPFRYRLSGAVGANTWGAITTATTAGMDLLVATHDNMCVYIQIDPAEVLAELSDATHVRVNINDTTASLTAGLFAAVAIVDPRYKMTTFHSATG